MLIIVSVIGNKVDQKLTSEGIKRIEVYLKHVISAAIPTINTRIIDPKYIFIQGYQQISEFDIAIDIRIFDNGEYNGCNLDMYSYIIYKIIEDAWKNTTNIHFSVSVSSSTNSGAFYWGMKPLTLRCNTSNLGYALRDARNELRTMKMKTINEEIKY